MGYAGEERRIHKVFMTRNSEYHMKETVCVGVRDRKSGQWLRTHMALKHRVSGGLRFTTAGGILPNPGMPAVGESMLFHASGRDVITSTIIAVERTPHELMPHYVQ